MGPRFLLQLLPSLKQLGAWPSLLWYSLHLSVSVASSSYCWWVREATCLESRRYGLQCMIYSIWLSWLQLYTSPWFPWKQFILSYQVTLITPPRSFSSSSYDTSQTPYHRHNCKTSFHVRFRRRQGAPAPSLLSLLRWPRRHHSRRRLHSLRSDLVSLIYLIF